MLIAGEQCAGPLDQELLHRSVKMKEGGRTVCSALRKNLWHRWKTIPGDVCPVPVIIPPLASQATTEFVGCCQILSPSCVLTLRGLGIPRLGTQLGIWIRELHSHRAAPLRCFSGSCLQQNQWSSSISSNFCSHWLLQMVVLSQYKLSRCLNAHSLFFLGFIFVSSFCF